MLGAKPAFDLFEEICVALSDGEESVLLPDRFSHLTLKDVKQWAQETAERPAVAKALEYLRRHFESRGSVLPFSYDLTTGRAVVVEREYLEFVSSAQDLRSFSKRSRDFELASSRHIAKRLTGIVRRVGSPRTKYNTRKEFAAYLAREFGFESNVLVGSDKDGGFDILWFPPLGAFPFRAIVSIQCKNSPYDRDKGLKSVGRAKQSLSRHSHAKAEEVHLRCLMGNDYIDEKVLDHARDTCFVPLGLSDLAPLTTLVSLRQL